MVKANLLAQLAPNLVELGWTVLGTEFVSSIHKLQANNLTLSDQVSALLDMQQYSYMNTGMVRYTVDAQNTIGKQANICSMAIFVCLTILAFTTAGRL